MSWELAGSVRSVGETIRSEAMCAHSMGAYLSLIEAADTLDEIAERMILKPTNKEQPK